MLLYNLLQRRKHFKNVEKSKEMQRKIDVDVAVFNFRFGACTPHWLFAGYDPFSVLATGVDASFQIKLFFQQMGIKVNGIEIPNEIVSRMRAVLQQQRR